jgi:hypothetical protein
VENFSATPIGEACPPGNAYILQRYYVRTDLHLGDAFRFFGELGSSLETGRNGGPRTTVDDNKLDVHQAFIDLDLLVAIERFVSAKFAQSRQQAAREQFLKIPRFCAK